MAKGHRLFAAAYDIMLRMGMGKALMPAREMAAGEATGRVLEIGVGTGANLAHYDWSRVESLDATDPDPYMLERAERKAEGLPGDKVRFHQAPAEALPFEDGSFDTVVATLVLCTVDDVEKSLAEVRRVLKPGGTFRLAEHVRSNGLMGRIQDILQPVYGWLAAGCHWNRRTEEMVRSAGFDVDVQDRLQMSGMPCFAGIASLRK